MTEKEKQVLDTVELEEDDVLLKEPLAHLSKDLCQASRDLNRRDARWLVDEYYTHQKARIRAKNQHRTRQEQAEPHELIKWAFQTSKRFERSLKAALGVFAREYVVGQWLQAQCGIADVLSAACLTHFDIRKAETVGHFWRFAGLDATCIWPSKDDAKKAVNEAIDECKAAVYVARNVPADYYKYSRWPKDPTDADVAAGQKLIDQYGAVKVRAIVPTFSRLHNRKGFNTTFDRAAPHFEDAIKFVEELCAEREILAPEAVGPVPFDVVRNLSERFGRNPFNLLTLHKRTTKGATMKPASLAKVLSRCPWNAGLKSIVAFRLGECFVRTCNLEQSFYGKLYTDRHKILAGMNVDGKFAERAAGEIERWKDHSTMPKSERWKHWQNGVLAPQHIHDMARRWVVRLFLSHLHHVMYVDYHGTEPPRPYVFEHPNGKDHRHMIDPPLWPGDYKGRKLAELKD